MNAALVAVATAMFIGGGFTVVAGLQRRERGGRPQRTSALQRRWRAMPSAIRVRMLVGVTVGLWTTLFTGFVPALLLVPAVIVVLPELLRAAPQPELALLEALDRWVRVLAASVGTGKSVPDAIRATRVQAPPVLAEPIRHLVWRLDGRWSLADALQAMADELDSADADAVLAALILVGERGGVGASGTLAALSDNLQDRLRAMREITAERAKPLMVVRQVTTITLVVLAAAAFMSPSYFAPYHTPLGQLLMLALAGAYLGSMVTLRRMAMPRHRDRILVRLQPAGVMANG